ncbi:hypothetical protein PAECIP111802_05305 [Paenibacillus allorhizosphaerae]|uniref:Uncharacterized protein n=1 Tax=Paenibacillus allorhizosphaerae TaxID=2849866 RepID=A0ABN7TRG2_9BACL|nr:hypothetical protein PAECIP111802_05305 [Paenibacillus allorhizosphaerae]
MGTYSFIKQGFTMPDGNIHSFLLVYEPGFHVIQISNSVRMAGSVEYTRTADT